MQKKNLSMVTTREVAMQLFFFTKQVVLHFGPDTKYLIKPLQMIELLMTYSCMFFSSMRPLSQVSLRHKHMQPN